MVTILIILPTLRSLSISCFAISKLCSLNCSATFLDCFETRMKIAMFKNRITMPRSIIPDAYVRSGSDFVGFPSRSTLMNLHLNVLHSNPNCPYFPTSVGKREFVVIIKAITGTTLHIGRKLFLLAIIGKYTATQRIAVIPKRFQAEQSHNPYKTNE